MKIIIQLLTFLLFSNSVLSADIGSYNPVTPKNLEQVDSLVETLQTISPPLKTRGVGQNIFKNVAPATAIVVAEEGEGSGFLIDNKGHIVTNFHVIGNSDGSFSQNVRLVFCPIDLNNLQNSIVYEAKVIKVDKTRDLALLSMNSPVDNKVSNIVSIEKNQTSINIGMDVHAIGHPEGNYCSYTKGVVSRKIDGYDWSYSATSLHKANVIQTQTPINPGNSGGPLINDMGRVVGINTFKNPDAVGINFAVSSNEIIDFIENGPVAEISAQVGCEDAIINSDDMNENGTDDIFSYDRDCNGIEDMFEYDEDEDGKADFIILDSNENGEPDMLISFGIHPDGEFKGKEYALVNIDKDENGEYEKECIDVDLDGEIDHCESLL